MTLQEAHTLLDMARQGMAIPQEVVAWALTITGDTLQSNWRAHQDIADFVQALRKAGLL